NGAPFAPSQLALKEKRGGIYPCRRMDLCALYVSRDPVATRVKPAATCSIDMHDTPWYINDYRAWLEEEAEQGQLDPEERFRRRWAELERKRRIRFRTPSIIAPRGNPELPRDILQSPVFSVEKAFGHSLTGDEPLRREHVHARLVAGFNQHNPQTILYIGPRLTQDHKAVLLGLFDVAAGRSPEDEIAIRPREFGVKVCGWSRSIYTREK